MRFTSFDANLMGVRIMQKRKEKGLRQQDLAQQIGLSNNHISNIERGKYLPSLRCLLRICEVLGETPDYYVLGSISKHRDDILKSLIAQCTPQEQQMLCHLLKTYLEQKNHGTAS